MQGSVRLWFSFCWKAIKSRSLLSSFSFQDSGRLTILCKQLLSNHDRTSKQTLRLITIMLLLLLCVAKRSSSPITVRSGQFESNLLTWPGRPNTHAWGSTSRFAHATFPFNYCCTEQAHRPRLQESMPRYDAGSWASLHPHVAAWEQRSNTVGRYVPALVQSST